MKNNNSFSDLNVQPQRKVSFLLGLGIFLMPYIFSWFTLRRGHSSTSKIIAFSWLGLILLSSAIKPPKNDVASNSSNPKTTLESSVIDTSKTLEVKTTPEPKKISQNESLSVKNAVVITENANLRKAGNSSGEVIQTISEGTNIEIIRQQGAWFLVKNNGRSGWMHGNTIRFVDSTTETEDLTIAGTNTDNYDLPSTYTSPSSSYSSPYSSYSSRRYSSSSYDYRPKTVRVRSYYRKDGTYVSSHTRRAPRRR